MIEDEGKIPILKIGDTLLASIQVSLHDKQALRFQEDILNRLDETKAKGMILDITALDVVDSFISHVIIQIAKMARLMGAKVVLVGIQPTVAMTLMEFGITFEGIETALNLDRGLKLLKNEEPGESP